MKSNSLIFVLAIALAFSCNKKPGEDEPVAPSSDNQYVNKCDFEKIAVDFQATGCSFVKAVNPVRDGLDRSANCGFVKTGSGDGDRVSGAALRRRFDFTRNEPVFKVKVLAPVAGATVKMYIESKYSGSNYPKPLEASAHVTTAGVWEELVFDFRQYNPESNQYQKFSFIFDADRNIAGEKWYFDDIMCPSDDLTDICLFQRYAKNPVFRPEGSNSWRNYHMANVGILSPSNSPDGNWWLYLRGSGDTPYYCDQIGLYTQPANDFHPFGPWNEYEKNPVCPVGPAGSYDDGYLLDSAPVVGKDGVVYIYYNGKSRDQYQYGLCVRYSEDGGYTFKHVDKPVLPKMGSSDAVYHDGKYYVFYGGGNPCKLYVTVTEDPLSFEHAQTYSTITLGGGPSNFDDVAVNGSMVFRLDGVDKWFATYQGSAASYDFPDRFHVAMSNDLIHWQKVQNDQPLFTRGSAGAWDQGGVWGAEIIEYKDNLYLYYEGWGRTGFVPDRDEPYFSGKSQVGVASCSKTDFLKWCGLAE